MKQQFVSRDTGEILDYIPGEYLDVTSLEPGIIRKVLTYSYSSLHHAACRRKRKWANRLIMHNEMCSNTYFCTLTFADEFYNDDFGYLRKSARDFIKRLRRYYEYHYQKKVKIFLACEAGEEKGRWHYHFIIFDAQIKVVDFRLLLDKLWKFGRTQALIANSNRLKYVAKYIVKGGKHALDQRYFIIYSRGLGQEWYKLNRFKRFGQYQLYTYIRGSKIKNDDYFRHKFFSKLYNYVFFDRNFGPQAWLDGKISLPSVQTDRVSIVLARNCCPTHDLYEYTTRLSEFAGTFAQALYDDGHYCR